MFSEINDSTIGEIPNLSILLFIVVYLRGSTCTTGNMVVSTELPVD